MRTINIHQAKTHLSRLVDEAEQGDSFIIAKAGKPKVLVSRLDGSGGAALEPQRIGFMKGMYTLPENYWEIDKELDAEILKQFFPEDEE
jgi:prevent-host-death family protein